MVTANSWYAYKEKKKTDYLTKAENRNYGSASLHGYPDKSLSRFKESNLLTK